jgi:hypothetical protein
LATRWKQASKREGWQRRTLSSFDDPLVLIPFKEGTLVPCSVAGLRCRSVEGHDASGHRLPPSLRLAIATSHSGPGRGVRSPNGRRHRPRLLRKPPLLPARAVSVCPRLLAHSGITCASRVSCGFRGEANWGCGSCTRIAVSVEEQRARERGECVGEFCESQPGRTRGVLQLECRGFGDFELG